MYFKMVCFSWKTWQVLFTNIKQKFRIKKKHIRNIQKVNNKTKKMLLLVFSIKCTQMKTSLPMICIHIYMIDEYNKADVFTIYSGLGIYSFPFLHWLLKKSKALLFSP